MRIRSFKKFYWDDAFVLIAWLMLLASAIIWQCISKNMYQALYIASGVSLSIPPTFIEDSQTYLRGMLAIILLFQSGLWSVKISFLLFFRRLGENVSGQKVHWWIAFAFTLATYFVGIGTIQYNCLTPSFADIIQNCSFGPAINFERTTLITNCMIDVSSDLMSECSFIAAICSISNISCSPLDPYSHAMGSSHPSSTEASLSRHLLSRFHNHGNFHHSLCGCVRYLLPARAILALLLERN